MKSKANRSHSLISKTSLTLTKFKPLAFLNDTLTTFSFRNPNDIIHSLTPTDLQTTAHDNNCKPFQIIFYYLYSYIPHIFYSWLIDTALASNARKQLQQQQQIDHTIICKSRINNNNNNNSNYGGTQIESFWEGKKG